MKQRVTFYLITGTGLTAQAFLVDESYNPASFAEVDYISNAQVDLGGGLMKRATVQMSKVAFWTYD